ncbi:MAG: hypothetical protein IJL92_08655 [Thermoguttaceae bacterium]|nr:hypothetical protein [Thermoguttaceae bacterium]
MSMRLFAVHFLVLTFVLCPMFSGETCRGETPSPSRSRVAAASVKAQERERRQSASASEPESDNSSASNATDEPAKKRSSGKKSTSQKKKSDKDKAAKTRASSSAKKERSDKPHVAPELFLRLEQTARRAAPDVVKGLTTNQRFSRRLPSHWSEVDVTDEQRAAIYEVQQSYFLEIAQLQARVERLKQERDASMLQILEPRQRARLEQILDGAASKRGGEVVEIVFEDEAE